MFDIGGWEFLIVIVIAIIVIGPKDLPGAIRTVTGWIRRARELAREFQSGIDELARETDMDNVKNEIQSGLGLDDLTESGNTIRSQIENTIDPDGDIEKAFKDDPAIARDKLEDDGPFADNSFEEDEDIDGAIDEDPDKRKEEMGSQSAEPTKAATETEADVSVLEKDAVAKDEPAADPDKKKSSA